jgi:hypothetical protein
MSFVTLQETYKLLGKPDHVKEVQKAINNIDQCLDVIPYNSEKKYDGQMIRPQYIQSKKEGYLQEAKGQPEDAYNRLKSSMDGEDLIRFMNSNAVESKNFNDFKNVLVPGVEQKLGSSDLATEIIIESGKNEFDSKFTELNEQLKAVKNTAMPLYGQRKAQIEIIKNSGLFPVTTNRLEAKAQKKIEKKNVQQKMQQDNKVFWGNMKQLLAGGAALGASALFPSLPGANVLSGVGNQVSQEAIGNLVSWWNGKELTELEVAEKKQLTKQCVELKAKFDTKGPVECYNALTKLWGEYDKSGKATKEEMESRVTSAKLIVDELMNQLGIQST